MRPNFSQVSSATTGQVASDEPRPISTSRQPVFPRKVTNTPLSRDLDPTTPVFGLIPGNVEADDLGAPQAAGKAEQQHGAVAQAAQRAAVERLQHGDEILGQDGFLLHRRLGVAVADAGQHGGDMPVLAVERLATLRIIPGQRRETALDRRHGVRFPVSRCLSGRARRDVEADDLRIGRQHLKMLPARPGAKMLPVGGVGAPGVGRACRLDVIAGAVGELFQMRRQAGCRLQGRGGRLLAAVAVGATHLHDNIDDVGKVVLSGSDRRSLIVVSHRHAASISVSEKSLPTNSSGSSARLARA